MTHEEAMAYLKAFMEEVNTQDNRSTARPIFFVIKWDEHRNGINWREEGCSLSESDAEQYLRNNRHNLGQDAHTYVKSMQSFPAMKKLFDALNVITAN